MENRKQEVKPSIADTQGAQPDSSRRLPDYQFISYLIALLTYPDCVVNVAPPGHRECT